MIEYIYLVKCPDRTEEPFDFFDEAKDFAIGCLSNNPIITQIEVDRNDFGECTDSRDLGTIWSWEDMMQDIDTNNESTKCVFTKDDLKQYTNDDDPEFQDDDFFAINNSEESVDPLDELFDANISLGIDGGDNNNVRVLSSYNPKEADEADEADELELDELFDANISLGISGGSGNNVSVLSPPGLGGLGENCSRKPIPDGMTIKDLVEEMEENEDTVECTWCEDLFDKDECRYELNLGWLCSRCQAAIMSRGETLTFRENNYWDFLDEDTDVENVEIDEKAEEAPKSMIEELEDADTYRERLTLCPECGGATTFDNETGICINCGFNTLTEDVTEPTLSEMVRDSIKKLTTDSDKLPDLEHAASFAFEVAEDIREKYNISFDKDFEASDKWYCEVTKEVYSQLIQLHKESNDPTYRDTFLKKKFELFYPEIEVTMQSAKRDVDDWDEWTETVEYTYEVDNSDVIECLADLIQEEDVTDIEGGLYALENLPEEDYLAYFILNFYDLTEKYEQELLKHWEDDAASAAQQAAHEGLFDD